MVKKGKKKKKKMGMYFLSLRFSINLDDFGIQCCLNTHIIESILDKNHVDQIIVTPN